jgi:hypothetical protein
LRLFATSRPPPPFSAMNSTPACRPGLVSNSCSAIGSGPQLRARCEGGTMHSRRAAHGRIPVTEQPKKETPAMPGDGRAAWITDAGKVKKALYGPGDPRGFSFTAYAGATLI